MGRGDSGGRGRRFGAVGRHVTPRVDWSTVEAQSCGFWMSLPLQCFIYPCLKLLDICTDIVLFRPFLELVVRFARLGHGTPAALAAEAYVSPIIRFFFRLWEDNASLKLCDVTRACVANSRRPPKGRESHVLSLRQRPGPSRSAGDTPSSPTHPQSPPSLIPFPSPSQQLLPPQFKSTDTLLRLLTPTLQRETWRGGGGARGVSRRRCGGERCCADRCASSGWGCASGGPTWPRHKP